MGSGGARNRSGPPPNPTSKRSDSRGLDDVARLLPASGFTKKAPAWPFPSGSTREKALWRKLWKYPQAIAWADEEWRWLTIANYVRWQVKSEAKDATPSVMTQVNRLADSIGLSPAGLRENRWEIIDDSRGQEDLDAAPTTAPPQRRMRAVPDAG